MTLHNPPFSDINDAEDDLQSLVFGATATRFDSVMRECQVNRNRMSERAHSDFLTVTELADTRVWRKDVSFRQAHQALDPVHFVKIRRIPGGPGEEAVRPALEEAEADSSNVEVWIEEALARLAAYPERIRRACGELLAASL